MVTGPVILKQEAQRGGISIQKVYPNWESLLVLCASNKMNIHNYKKDHNEHKKRCCLKLNPIWDYSIMYQGLKHVLMIMLCSGGTLVTVATRCQQPVIWIWLSGGNSWYCNWLSVWNWQWLSEKNYEMAHWDGEEVRQPEITKGGMWPGTLKTTVLES